MASDEPRPRAREKACDKAILKTLAYSSVFNYPMSKFQIYKYLITKNKFSHEFFEKSLKRLVKMGHIKSKDSKYYLPGMRPVSWNLRDKYSRDLMEENKIVFKLLKKIPWIKMLAVTGSVASNNAVKEDDIDVFIVAQKNRMWITRFFVYLILQSVNKYAFGENNKTKLCCNIFVDEENLEWDKKDKALYIAYEIASMHPIIDRDYTYFRFINKNKWIGDHFANFIMEEKIDKVSEQTIGSGLIDIFENLARKLQLNYMKNKKTSEVTTKTLIHFNKHDHSQKIMEDYKATVAKISEKK